MGVGISLLGASMLVLDILLWISSGAWVGSRELCGEGVGCCMGTLGLVVSFNSWVGIMRASSGGQVVRPAMLSCSTGETMASSSGVGIVR